jgi:hypothetical protein
MHTKHLKEMHYVETFKCQLQSLRSTIDLQWRLSRGYSVQSSAVLYGPPHFESSIIAIVKASTLEQLPESCIMQVESAGLERLCILSTLGGELLETEPRS